MPIPTGTKFKQDKDEHGLTLQERRILVGVFDSKTLTAAGADYGISRARAANIGKSLLAKGWLYKYEKGKEPPTGVAGRRNPYVIATHQLKHVLAIKEALDAEPAE